MYEAESSLVALLLRHGADPNLYSPEDGLPLINACTNNRIGVVKLLLEYGTDPSIAHFSGETALDYAEEVSEIAQMLINAHLEPILK